MKKLFLLLLFIPTLCYGGVVEQVNMVLATHGATACSTNYITSAAAAYYMDDADNETDETGNGNTLTESATNVPTSATVPTGYSGTSRDFEFDGSTGLRMADGGETDVNGVPNGKISAFAWVKFESSAASMMIINKYVAESGKRQFRLFYNQTSDVMTLFLSSDGESAQINMDGASNAVNDGNWHHVGFVCNDIVCQLYLDGATDGSSAAHTAGIFNGSDSFTLGSTTVAGNAFDGLMDEVIIDDTDFSAAQILDLYNCGIDGAKGAND